ncbi:hypothetical protein I5L42_14985 [Pseudomonas aeruginosa]|nr:hypothetical protein [Pseudomonas aeruginosa]
MPEQAVTLEALYVAIEQVLRERLPEVTLIGFWPGVPERTPAVALEVAELLPERDPGTGESALSCRLQARVLVPLDADRQAVALAGEIVRALRGQTGGLALEPARLVRATVDSSREELKGLRAWLVEWTQALRLGEPEWAWEDQPPGSLLLGLDPWTGPGHEADYFAPEDLP